MNENTSNEGMEIIGWRKLRKMRPQANTERCVFYSSLFNHSVAPSLISFLQLFYLRHGTFKEIP